MVRDRKHQQTAQELAYENYMRLQREEEKQMQVDISTDADDTEFEEEKALPTRVEEKPVTKKQVETEVKKEEQSYDFVNHPSSYTNHVLETKQGTIVYETIEYLESLAKRLSQWLNPDEVFNVVSGAKYLDGIRGSKPDGDKTPRQKIAEDCEKIAWYLNRASWLIRENDKSRNK